ncbi:MAG: SAM-dependent methyltransferase [Proteobacteria bacterium]|nr:SAM-dependent methyltransferase [Pseudomonadota bacterium]
MPANLPATLAEKIAATIRHSGPISIAHYMSEAIANQTHGYYATQQPFGLEGDFITAPEVSQMFGELVGLWCASLWSQMGRPETVNLVELGPGRGTLMADAWRAAGAQPGFHDAANLHFVEVSPKLRQQQQHALTDARPRSGPHWHIEFAAVPSGPLVLIANELLDALPIHQYQRMTTGWHERLVDIAPEPETFRVVLAPQPVETPETVPQVFAGTPIGAVVECCPAAEALVTQVAERCKADGGGALFVDYGYTESSPHETLQGVRRHAGHPVFVAPGSADLCAHVDFARLHAVATGAGVPVWGPIGQGDLLTALGIDARAERLKQNAATEQCVAIDSAVDRLVSSAKMGALFKAMAITGPGLVPAGFAENAG